MRIYEQQLNQLRDYVQKAKGPSSALDVYRILWVFARGHS